MTKQLLIYEQTTPITQERHGNWSVKTGTDYSFARQINSVPLMAVEFPKAATEYAIVFTGTETSIMPVAILGIKEQENLYLKETGDWQAKYIPAFIRRYPFVFSSNDEGNTFTLCIDEGFAGCNQEGRGERLFDTQGTPTQYLESVLAFLKEFQMQHQRTQVFCNKLKALDLLEPMRVKFTLDTGEQSSLAGFMAVNRDRLNQLSGEQLVDLLQTNELELLYLHLQSMRNFNTMVERIAQ
ncbi:SapC family protein [Nostoc sp. FACHB-152]|uniref:SapC family protein n=1 Tax=unclassified Nostoc TaxID=2593658 RepID=UPI0016864E9C|nr:MULTISPECIES: SapC family protein [unclassified Nostoc]MBD2449020.1 SapC family protein [Nostoc sp. FACHB-152]MBD2469750.1 SapC family protein [Nostoc sp. FACHB-145]